MPNKDCPVCDSNLVSPLGAMNEKEWGRCRSCGTEFVTGYTAAGLAAILKENADEAPSLLVRPAPKKAGRSKKP
jgi:hypothetical protein